jgi:hypothetical protein
MTYLIIIGVFFVLFGITGLFNNTIHYIERPNYNVTDVELKILKNKMEQLQTNYDIMLENIKNKPVLLYYNLPIKSIERYYSVFDNTIYGSNYIRLSTIQCIANILFKDDHELTNLQQVNLNYDAISKVVIPKDKMVQVYMINKTKTIKIGIYKEGEYDGRILKGSSLVWIGHIEDQKDQYIEHNVSDCL